MDSYRQKYIINYLEAWKQNLEFEDWNQFDTEELNRFLNQIGKPILNTGEAYIFYLNDQENKIALIATHNFDAYFTQKTTYSYITSTFTTNVSLWMLTGRNIKFDYFVNATLWSKFNNIPTQVQHLLSQGLQKINPDVQIDFAILNEH